MAQEDTYGKTEFTKWVNDYSDSMYSWAYYKVSDEFVAQDLVQDTFLAAYKSLDKFRADSKPKTWLFSILRNKIIDHYRKNLKNNTSSLDEKEENAFQLTDGFFNESGHWNINNALAEWDEDQNLLDDSEFKNVFDACIEHLPDKWKLAVKAKYIAEADGKDICQELEITSTNYWQIIHRAKLMLKECIELNWFKK